MKARKLHDIVLKVLVALNLFSLAFWICNIEGIISWQPYVIMAGNLVFLVIVAYANGWVYDTKPYYERLRREAYKARKEVID